MIALLAVLDFPPTILETLIELGIWLTLTKWVWERT